MIHECNRQTDTQTQHDGIGCAYAKADLPIFSVGANVAKVQFSNRSFSTHSGANHMIE